MTEIVEHWSKVRMKLAWQSHVLAPALAALTFVQVEDGWRGVKTAAIDQRGRVFLTPAWCAQRTDGEVRFVILHECLHAVLRHHERTGSRDRTLWNIAADLVINDAILGFTALGAERPKVGVFRDTHAPNMPANLSTEEVYEYLYANAIKVTVSGSVGDGCGVVNIDASEGDGAGLSESEWRNVVQGVADAARSASAGNSVGSLAPLLRIPPSRVRWRALVRQLAATAISQAGRDDTTWARRSRRSPPGVILPGTRSRVVKLAVIIDSSGSMSDDEVSACVAEARAAVDAAGITALLVVHDADVQAQAWITPGSGAVAIASQIKGRGGTAFSPAYDAVAAASGTFAAVVHFTDGYPCEPWPPVPPNCRRAVCALTPEGSAAGVPAPWQVVPIEIPGRG